MKNGQLNDFEVMTLFEAYSRLKRGETARIFLNAPYKTCREKLPLLIGKGLVNRDHLKYGGVIVLTEKGIEKGKMLYDAA